MKTLNLFKTPSILFRKNLYHKSVRFASSDQKSNQISTDQDSLSYQSLKDHNWLVYDPKHLVILNSLAFSNVILEINKISQEFR